MKFQHDHAVAVAREGERKGIRGDEVFKKYLYPGGVGYLSDVHSS